MAKTFILTFLLCGPLYAKKLSFEDVSSYLFANNHKVQLAQLDLKIAQAEMLAGKKDFDWNMALAGHYQKSKELQNSSLEKNLVKENVSSFSLGFTKKIISSTNFELSFQSIDTQSDGLNVISPQYVQSVIFMNIKQPLLRGWQQEYQFTEYKKSFPKHRRYEQKLILTFSKEYERAIEQFLKIYKIKEKIVAKKGSVEFFEKLYKYTSAAHRKGKKDFLEVLELETKVLKEKTLLVKFVNERDILLAKLNNTLGVRGEQNFQINDLVFDFSFFSTPLSTFLAPDKHPEALMNYYALEEANVDVKAARSALLPKLDLELEYKSQGLGNNFSKSFAQTETFDNPHFKVALNFSWEFGANTNRGRYWEKKQRWEQRKWEYHQQMSRQEKILKDLQYELEQSKKNFEYKKTIVKNNTELLNFHKKSLELGKKRLLDFMQEFNKLEKERLELVNLQHSYFQNYFKLMLRDPEFFQQLTEK